MGIMQRTTEHGIRYSCETDLAYRTGDGTYLTMLDAYILAHALDTTEAFRAHRKSHEADIAEMEFWAFAQRAGMKPAQSHVLFVPLFKRAMGEMTLAGKNAAQE